MAREPNTGVRVRDTEWKVLGRRPHRVWVLLEGLNSDTTKRLFVSKGLRETPVTHWTVQDRFSHFRSQNEPYQSREDPQLLTVVSEPTRVSKVPSSSNMRSGDRNLSRGTPVLSRSGRMDPGGHGPGLLSLSRPEVRTSVRPRLVSLTGPRERKTGLPVDPLPWVSGRKTGPRSCTLPTVPLSEGRLVSGSRAQPPRVDRA